MRADSAGARERAASCGAFGVVVMRVPLRSIAVEASVRVRNTSSSVASRAVQVDGVDAAASSARMTSMRRVPSTTGSWRSRRSSSNVGALDANCRVASATASHVGERPDRDVDAIGADARLQLVGAAVRDRAAVVEHDDVVGELVGLLEVLRREHDRGAVAYEVAQHLPQIAAAARVEAGGRLVEEQHRRRGHEARGEVEAAAHAAREGLHERGRPRRSRSRRSSSSSARCSRMPLGRWCRRPTITRFFRALSSPSTRRLLRGDADALAHARRAAATTSKPATRRRALGRRARAW